MAECKRPELTCPYKDTYVDGEDAVIEVRCTSIPCLFKLEQLLKALPLHGRDD